jgi:hypothetical protein
MYIDKKCKIFKHSAKSKKIANNYQSQFESHQDVKFEGPSRPIWGIS